MLLFDFVCVIWFFTSQSCVDPVLRKDQCFLLEDTMKAWTRNSSVSSQALYHRATSPLCPLLFEENVMPSYAG